MIPRRGGRAALSASVCDVTNVSPLPPVHSMQAFKGRVQVSHVLYASSRDVRGPAARYELNAGDLRSHDHSAPSIWW